MTTVHDRRTGISFVDVITAMLCMSIVAALAMPYLLQMRSATRTDECLRKIRAIIIASHNYHDAHRRLPPATTGWNHAVDAEKWADDEESDVYWKKFQYTNSLFVISPFFGNDEMLGRYNDVHPVAFDTYSDLTDYAWGDGKQVYEWQGDIDGISDVMTAEVEEFLCTEDNLAEQSLPAIIATQPCLPMDETEMGSLDKCRDIAIQYWPNEEDGPGYTNFVACLGVYGQAWTKDDPEKNRWRGAMSPRIRIRLEAVGDGTSRTIMYGETLGENIEGERKNAMSWAFGGGARIAGHMPFGTSEHPDHMSATMIGDADNSSGTGFATNHGEIMLFGFCDGSVHRVKIDVDRETLYQLAAAFDGGVPMDFSAD